MKTKQVLFGLFILLSIGLQAQKGVVNKGAKIIISNGAFINIDGGTNADYTNKSYDASSHGKIDLLGKIKIEGDWLNQATSGNVFINTATDGEIVFDGATQQTIGGTASTYFEKITLNNPSGLALGASTLVKGTLTLTSGLLKIGAYNLMLDASVAIAGSPSATAMILPNSTGSVFKYLMGTGIFTFPVGDTLATDEYSPFSLTFNSGTFGAEAYVKLNVINGKHPNNSSSLAYLNRYWTVTPYNISSFNADVSAKYTDGDIFGSESSIFMAKYNSPYWDKYNAANTVSNLISANITSFSDFTGAESTAITPAIALTYDGSIIEGNENGEVITITLKNDDFVASLNTNNWIVTNLPQGVTKGTLTRTGTQTATLALSGNRTNDFDSNITDISFSVAAAEFVHSSALINASSGVTITATNDAESITMADDGLISESSEDGEIITVTAVGGTFANPITLGNWTLTKIPTGVAIGAVTWINSTTVKITLSGNASLDYDSDSLNSTLSISAAEINDYTGANLSVNTGVKFTAIDESLTISMASDGLISESAENNELITVTISGKTFAASLTPANWTITNLPQGVIKGALTRIGDTTATIALFGNRTQDYDANITNMSIQIAAGEIELFSSVAYITSGVTFTANPDIETIALSDNGILEGAEHSKIITATLIGGTYASVLFLPNWTVTNLPDGVSVGSINRVSATMVELYLFGNRTKDFDSNITNVTVSVAHNEIDDYSGSNISASTGVTITATNDSEILVIADDGSITEGNEDGELITVTLSGGTIVSSINVSNWVLSNLPSGVTANPAVRLSPTSVSFTLVGNATQDYDANIANTTLTVFTSEIDDTTGTNIIINSGVTFIATDEPLLITLSDNGIIEGAENGEVITVTVEEDTFIATINEANWFITNLPIGVSKGVVTRVSDNTVTIALLGNRNIDYDADIMDVTVQFEGAELMQHTASTISKNTGLLFGAIVDDEFFTLGYDGEILEGAENDELITVTLYGGTFANPLNAANWTLTNLPTGVVKGTITRLNETTATIALSGNRTTDYDENISDVTLSISDTEIDDYVGINLTQNSGVIFTAINETINLFISDDGITEGNESNEAISVTITGDTFKNPLTPSNWNITELPAGVSIGSIARTSNTTAAITLLGNRTKDYDVSITDANLTIKSTEFLDQVNDVSQNTGVTFIATDDIESIAISYDGAILEGQENGEKITVTLLNGTFGSNLFYSNWTISNQPSGVVLGSVLRIDSVTVELTLLGTSNADYDADISNFKVSVSELEVDDYSGSNLELVSGIVFTSLNESLAVSHTALIESNLNGVELNLVLTGDTFIDPILDNNNFILNNAPIGLSIDYLTYIDETHASLFLKFNNTDFDFDIVAFELSISTDEISGILNLTSNPIAIVAENDEEIVSMNSDGLIEEGTENGEVISVSIAGGTFASTINSNNWIFSNLPPGVSISILTKVNSNTVEFSLIGNSIEDYDLDITTFEIQIGEAEIDDYSGISLIVNTGVTFTAINEMEIKSLTITASQLIESTLNGAIVSAELTNDYLIDETIDVSNISVLNAPLGLTISGITYINSSFFNIELDFDGTDFDSDILNFQIGINGVELNSAVEIVSNELSIKAIIKPEANLGYDGQIIEGHESGELLEIYLLSGSFVQEVPLESIIFSELPVGVTFGNLIRISDTLMSIELIGTRIVDYDIDISASCTIDSSAIINFSGSPIIAQSQIIFTAFDEKLTISGNELNTENLNGAEILMELTNDRFSDEIIDVSNITLYNAPLGMSINIVNYINETQAMLLFAFDGTDFATDINNFHIGLSGTECLGMNDLVSNDLPIYKGLGIIENSKWNVKIYSSSEIVFVSIEELYREWESASIKIYTIKGEKVLETEMLKENINIIKPNVKTGNYIVNVTIDGIIFVNKVYIATE